MKTYGYIYITTNKINGNRYIGQHKSVDWDSNYIGSGILLGKAIKKYGIENFQCFPLAWSWNKDELNQLEIDYIAHYKPEYNIAKGGDGGSYPHSEETNKKISEGIKKYWNIKGVA
jgi:group I intron endonuclease